MTGRAAAEALDFNRIETAPRPSDRYKGHVAIEGLQARYDAVTEFAELVDGQMYTDLELTYDGEDLYGPDGRSLTDSAVKGLEKAKEAAAKNPNLGFEVERRGTELEEIEEAKDMVKDYLNGTSQENTLVITSDYPLALQSAGAKAPGYNDERQQAMDRIIAIGPDGKITLHSQTLDASNRQALEAMDQAIGFETQPGEMLGQRRRLALASGEQSTLSHRRRDIYDRKMAAQLGGEWFAGRRPVDYRNTYEFVCQPQQRDLVDTYVSLKLGDNLTDSIMYDLAATMNARFARYKADKKTADEQVHNLSSLSVPARPEHVPSGLYDEIRAEGMLARRAGKEFVACGSTWKAEGSDDSTDAQLENAGYGTEPSKEWHGGKVHKNAKCVSCKKVKDEVGACHICKNCVEHPKSNVRTIQGRTADPQKAKINKESAKIFSFEEAREAREKRQAAL